MGRRSPRPPGLWYVKLEGLDGIQTSAHRSLQYQIDCIANFRDPGSRYDCQGILSFLSSHSFSVTSYLSVIRVFGFFTRAQLHHERFWNNLSQQLQRRGQEHIGRCSFRNKPLSVGNNVILPAQFPPLEYSVPPSAPFVKVSEEDIKDVSEIVGVFKIQVLSPRAIDSLYACVCSLHHTFPRNSRVVQLAWINSSCYLR